MIQRIQSVFLLIVVILAALLLALPVYVFPDIKTVTTGAEVVVKSYGVKANVLLSIITGAIGMLSLIAILLYKNRNLQLRICKLNMLLLCTLTGLLFFPADTMGTSLDQRVSYQYGAYLPLIQLIFTFLASRAIKKDEELVRSADRIR